MRRQTSRSLRSSVKSLDKPESLITHVADRKGHDMRYAIDPTKITNELGWLPETNSKMVLRRRLNGILKIRNGGRRSFPENTRTIMRKCMLTGRRFKNESISDRCWRTAWS